VGGGLTAGRGTERYAREHNAANPHLVVIDGHCLTDTRLSPMRDGPVTTIEDNIARNSPEVPGIGRKRRGTVPA